jgi:formylglycine-generating enzyme required for sulfatase activity
MSYCLNPNCQAPANNPARTSFCLSCGAWVLLKDRYRAQKLLGQGGFGKTFKAVDEHQPSQPLCVIKQFEFGSNNPQIRETALKLFYDEARHLESLGKHYNIPELLAYFDIEGQPYLIQQFIDGQDLEQELATAGVFDQSKIRKLLLSFLPVLDFLHTRSIPVIHRDIKPANIIRRCSDDSLVLVDFGAAKQATKTMLGKTGTLIGSPEYTAPEQIRGKPTFASDIYSLGVTCIHLLTQVSPFDLFDINQDAWVWRDYLVNNPVDAELGRVLDRMIANSLPQRYQSAGVVLAALGESSPVITDKATLQNSKTSDDEFEQVLQSLDRMLNNSPPQQYKLATGVSTALENYQPAVTQESIPQNLNTIDDDDLARISDFNLDNFTQTPVKPLNNQPALQSFEFETAKIRIEELGGLWGHTKVVIEKSRGQSTQFVEDFGDGVNLEMVAIPGGSFLMGAPESELESDNNERPQHQVQVTPFYMSKYVITVAQYQTVMRDRSYTKDRADLPMTCEWSDAVAFCEKLSKGLKRNYRLPSEAEWEYACRAGTTTPFYFGETIDKELAQYDAWQAYGRGQKVEYHSYNNNPKNVGSYPANTYGLCDMHGNEQEWCADSWHRNYMDAPTNGSAWISSNSNEYVIRGMKSSAKDCRSAARKNSIKVSFYRNKPIYSPDYAGFRVIYS